MVLIMESNPSYGLDHSDGSESDTNLDELPGPNDEIEENCNYLKNTCWLCVIQEKINQGLVVKMVCGTDIPEDKAFYFSLQIHGGRPRQKSSMILVKKWFWN